MKITIITTQNGWIVTTDEDALFGTTLKRPDKCWSFNSLDKAVAKLRELMTPNKPESTT